MALAEVYGQATVIRPNQPERELASKSSAAIHKALALDDELAEAHAALGARAARYEYDWLTAERHLRHALELNPSSAKAHFDLAQNVLAPQGRWQEAEIENRLAGELDPLSPRSVMGSLWLADLEGRHEVALEGFRKLAAASPDNSMAAGFVAGALADKGDYQGALKMFQERQRVMPSSLTLAQIGNVHARSGNVAGARKILQQLLVESKRQFVSPFCLFCSTWVWEMRTTVSATWRCSGSSNRPS